MNSFTLKIVGIISMLSDHLGKVFFPKETWLQYIGRFAFPIFAFEISEGYIHTKNFKKYITRLVLFAIISQIPYSLFLSTQSSDWMKLNIIFTLLLGLVAIYAYDKISNKYLSISLILILCILAETANANYGAYGIGTIILFYLYNKSARDKHITPKRKTLQTVTTIILFAIITFLEYLEPLITQTADTEFWIYTIIYTVISITPLLLYNGKLGPNCKYIFYYFYPTHLFAIYIIWMILQNSPS